MAPASLLSGVWENVKLSGILGFMSLGLSYQIYILFSLYIFTQLLKLPSNVLDPTVNLDISRLKSD